MTIETAVRPAAAARQRIAHLDGLRGAAALFVVLHHGYCMAYPRVYGVVATGLVGALIGWWALYGHFAVTVFIVLAGWSLAHSSLRDEAAGRFGFWSFMRRRAWRIIPPYYAALALTIVLATTYVSARQGTYWDLSVPSAPRGWLMDELLVQDVTPFRDAAYPFWSIAVEWHIYLLLPVMFAVSRRRSWTTAVGLGAAVSGLGMVAAQLDPRLSTIHFAYYLLFAVAVGARVAIERRPEWLPRICWTAVAAAGFGVTVVACAVMPFGWVAGQYDWLDVVLGAGVVALLLACETGGCRSVRRILAARPLAGVGGFSYSLYLVHAPLLAVLWRATIPSGLTDGQELAVVWGVHVPVIIAASYAFHRAAERPFLRLSRQARVGSASKAVESRAGPAATGLGDAYTGSSTRSHPRSWTA